MTIVRQHPKPTTVADSRSGTGIPPPKANGAQTADYLQDMILELRGMAIAGGYDRLARSLESAYCEAMLASKDRHNRKS